MNKRGAFYDNLAIDSVVYGIFVVIVAVGLFLFVTAFQDGAAVWEDFYAKEIALVINSAEPGEEVVLDVSPGTHIAFSNGVARSDVFSINNVHNEVTVRLTHRSGTSFRFFNDVDIVNVTLETPSGTEETNRLRFSVVEVQRDDA